MMDKRIVVSVLIALALAALVAFVVMLTLPLAEPLVWALILGVATHHQYERLGRRFPERPGRAAGIMVAVVTLCLILPISALLLALAQNATALYHQSQEFIQTMTSTGTSALSRIPLASRAMALADRFGIEIGEHASQIASSASRFLVAAASGAVKNMAHFILTLAMAVFILFFIYRDGERVVHDAVRRFSENGSTARHYLREMRLTTSAVVVGTLLTCLAQGALAGIGYFVAGLPAPILFGCLSAIAALIPVVGVALVWIPLVAYLALTGELVKAGLLAGWCAIFVGLADNIIRPLTIGGKRDIPVLAVVFGAVGGAQFLGLLGLLVGPIIFALVVAAWRDVTVERGTAALPPGEEGSV